MKRLLMVLSCILGMGGLFSSVVMGVNTGMTGGDLPYLLEDIGGGVSVEGNATGTPEASSSSSAASSSQNDEEEKSEALPSAVVVVSNASSTSQAATSSLDMVDVHATDEARQEALCEAIREGNVNEVLGLIARGADVRASDGDGRTPLHWAAFSGRAAVVIALIDNGAGVDVNARDQLSGSTPLHVAARNDDMDTVIALIARGADVNARDQSSGNTPLHVAAMNGNVNAVIALIARGADVNAHDELSGNTPLHDAAFGGHAAVVYALIERGADTSLLNKSEQKPLGVARGAAIQAMQEAQPIMQGLLINRLNLLNTQISLRPVQVRCMQRT